MALYYFLAGKIRVLENKLLNETDVERMVEAPDFNTAFKALHDTDYGSHLLDVEPHKFQQALDDDFQQVKNLLGQWVQDERMLEFLFLKFDGHNIKLFLKIKYGDISLNEDQLNRVVSRASLTAPENIQAKIVNDDSETSLLPITEQLLTRAVEKLPDQPTGFDIDSIVDAELFAILSERVDKVSSKIVRELYAIQRQTAWLKTFLRARLMEKPVTDMKLLLPSEYLEQYDTELEVALGRLPLVPTIYRASQNYLDHKKLWMFEKDLEEAELAVIRQAKSQVGGVEPVIGYFYAKTSAIRNIRLILTAKENEIPADEIKQRVRALY